MIGLMIRPSHLDAPGQQPKREIGMMDPSDPHNLHDTADHEVLETIDIATEGNDCDECVRRLREPLLHVKGVKQVKADPAMERVRVTVTTSSADPTMRNITSADAAGEITLGAMPPSINPML